MPADNFFSNVLKDGINDMVFIIQAGADGQFYYEFINQAAKERTTLTDDVIGQSIQHVYPNETAAFLTDKYQRVLETRDLVTYENRYTSPSGVRYSETTLSPHFDSNSEITHIIALVKDIKERNLNKEEYRSLYDYNLDAILTFDTAGSIQNGNSAVETLFGYRATELKNKRFTELISYDDIPAANQLFHYVCRGVVQKRQLRVQHKSSSVIKAVVKLTPIVVEGTITGFYGIFKDVDDTIELGRKYKESEDHFRIIAENSSDLITMINRHEMIDYVSPSYREVLGFDPDEYTGKHFLHNVHFSDREHLHKSFTYAIETKTTWNEQFRQKHGDGCYIWSELRGSPVYNEEDAFTHMVVLSRNITVRKDYESKLRHMAYHDPLTGVPNRRYFMKQFTECLARTKDTEKRLAILMMDLDQFKMINDRMGHDIGDKVIQEFARRISQSIRKQDILARLGGDEFMLLLPDIETPENAKKAAERILAAMDGMWFVEGYTFKISMSLGVVVSSACSPVSANELLNNADKQLYEAKQAGKNNYKIYDFMDRMRPNS
ncbi:diguanylate cyclase [Lentibacillus lipolyticus]|nr:diguanylate cyclase [Lentibacillus lipolyticus]